MSRTNGSPARVAIVFAASCAAWGGPELRARAAYAVGRRLPIIAIELGAGYVLLPVHGLRDGTAPVYAVEGPWISLGVDLGLNF